VLAKYDNPEKAYVEVIMPEKLNLNLKYINEKSFVTDLRIIFQTLAKIF
jgi:lipopolysaccharide/colanic/teichoic acid biosynthesis glycosyltransferase